MAAATASSPKAVPQLPPEIWTCIASFLPGRDIKNLGLASRMLRRSAPLRFERVFLSPNPLNICVFFAIAYHDVYRHDVVEIVYDDARLPKSHVGDDLVADSSAYGHEDQLGRIMEQGEQADEEWFRSRREDNISTLWARLRSDIDRPAKLERQQLMDNHDTLMPEEAAWAYYQELVTQQELSIAANADANAFLLGLEHFPNLKRVTITPLAHGFLFTPAYQTPMIRAFPPGFNYPLSRGWPSPEYYGHAAMADPWVSDSLTVRSEDVRAKWRGYCVVTRALAEYSDHHNVTELVIEGCLVRVGLNIRLFEERGQDYDNYVKILSRPGFRRLDISLVVDGGRQDRGEAMRTGLFRNALAHAPDLQSLSVGTDVDGFCHLDTEFDREPVPLSIVFPDFTQLQHFRLWNFTVQVADLISFLSRMPQTLKLVELAFLLFFSEDENHRYLLEEMRSTLSWRHWDSQPGLRFAVEDLAMVQQYGRAHWLDTEADEFLYGNGQNPFGLPNGKHPNNIMLPIGALQDPLDADYKIPGEYYSQYDMDGNVRPSQHDIENNTPAFTILTSRAARDASPVAD